MSDLFKNAEVKLVPGLVPVFFVTQEKDAAGNWPILEWGILHMSCVPDVGEYILKDGVKYRASKMSGGGPNFIVRSSGGIDVGVAVMRLKQFETPVAGPL